MMSYTRSVVVASVASVSLAASAFADWPNYRGPNTDAIVSLANAPDKLAISPVWKIPSGDAFGQISVVNDKAFGFVKRDEDEYAVGLDAQTGKELWATRIDKTIKDGQGGDGPRTTPAVDSGRVYIYGTNMKLACLDAADGKVLWQHDIAQQFGGKIPHWGNAASPLVVDELVIIVGGGPGKGILAFDKASGKLAWAKTSDTFTHATPTIATILGAKQVICFMQSGLVSVDAKTGQVLWTFAHPYETSTAASPVVGGSNGDIVYCSAGYGVGAAACRVAKSDDGKWTAKELWRTAGKNVNHWSTPVYRDGYIYGMFGHNDSHGPLACLDIETGQVKWSHGEFGSQGGLILLGDKLLVQSAGNLVLVAASPDGFKELGRASVFQGKNWTAPSYSDGMVYLRNASDKGTTPEATCVKLGQ